MPRPTRVSGLLLTGGHLHFPKLINPTAVVPTDDIVIHVTNQSNNRAQQCAFGSKNPIHIQHRDFIYLS